MLGARLPFHSIGRKGLKFTGLFPGEITSQNSQPKLTLHTSFALESAALTFLTRAGTWAAIFVTAEPFTARS